MAEEVKLFETWSSPFSLRIAMALKLKVVPFESIPEDLSNKSDLLLEYNPVYKKIPVLLHNGKPISESLVILEYVDETWKQNPLLPQYPYERASARFWAKFNDDTLMPSMWSVVRSKGEAQEAAVVEATGNLKILEGELKGKKFFGGEKIGFLDIVMGWLAYLIDAFEVMFGLKLIDPEMFPLLTTWMKEFYHAPVFKELWPPRDELVSKFTSRHVKQTSE